MQDRFNYFRKSILIAQKLLGNNIIFKSIEGRVIRYNSNDLIPPIFIIGAPRTGSTLLFQLLIQKYYFTYLDNLQSFFYGFPALVETITQEIKGGKISTGGLDSHYGYIKGVFSPSEAGAVFRHWFGENDFSLSSPQLSERRVRNTIHYLSTLASAPFLSKNLFNALRIRRISSVFPEAFFVWIKRDPLYSSQSLIEMRRALYGTEASWASVKPDNYESLLKYEPFEQVVRQIKAIDDYIRKALDDSSGPLYIDIHYEDLCDKPREMLDLVAKTYKKKCGIEFNERPLSSPPLAVRNKKRLQDSEWQRLVHITNRVYGGGLHTIR